MEFIRLEKSDNWDALVICRKQGTCPETSVKRAEGPVECVDGNKNILILMQSSVHKRQSCNHVIAV